MEPPIQHHYRQRNEKKYAPPRQIDTILTNLLILQKAFNDLSITWTKVQT